MEIKFDAGFEHFYLVERARKAGSTLTPKEKIELLQRQYGVSFDLARKAVNHAENK